MERKQEGREEWRKESTIERRGGRHGEGKVAQRGERRGGRHGETIGERHGGG